MAEALIALRDFLVVLALSWIGVTAEPVRRETASPVKPPCVAGGQTALCERQRPSFNVQECG
jgi:hypothetical protein